MNKINTENNVRFRETEDKILQAVGRLSESKVLEKITVSDICREAKIHRTTFYGHFQDMQELKERLNALQFEMLIRSFQREERWNTREGICSIFRFFRENSSKLKTGVSREKILCMLDENIGDGDLPKQFREAYRKQFNCSSEEEMRYHFVFFRTGFLALLVDWIWRGCVESPERMTEYVCKIYGFRYS